MKLYLYNTLTKSKEEFIPINSAQVGIYSCGPTVYSAQHLGNMRATFVVDLLKNTLKYPCGYTTKHVMNITDVWHLTGDNEWDADHGEDRMEKGARKEWITAWDVAKKFTDIYLEDLKELRIDDMDVMPRATDHITQQIVMIQELETKWHTYILPWDGVYMDTSTMQNYGILVGQKHLDGIQSGTRVGDSDKRNPTDFALWKFNMTGRKRDMERDSPWWVGFPWWHIECSAMSMEYLWDQIDIHTGWVEHIPVHHTNEIAQAECSHGHHPWVNYWVHYQHLMMNGQKLSKSTGNVAFMSDILDRWYSGQDLRMFYLQTHYRSFQDFTWEWLEAAKQARIKLHKRLSSYDTTQVLDCELIDYLKEVLLDDLNTPQLVARLFTSLDVMDDQIATAIKWLDDHVLKLSLFEVMEVVVAPVEIKILADQRRQAKLDKDYTKADEIRSQLTQWWWNMLDGKDGYELEKI